MQRGTRTYQSLSLTTFNGKLKILWERERERKRVKDHQDEVKEIREVTVMVINM